MSSCAQQQLHAAAIFSLEDITMLLTGEQPPDFKDDFAAFDRRLDERLKGRGERDTD